MTEPSLAPGEIVLDAVVPPGRPWGHRVAQGDRRCTIPVTPTT